MVWAVVIVNIFLFLILYLYLVLLLTRQIFQFLKHGS
jgi:hypothetical protein